MRGGGGWAFIESAYRMHLLGSQGWAVMPGFGQEVSGRDLRNWELALGRHVPPPDPTWTLATTQLGAVVSWGRNPGSLVWVTHQGHGSSAAEAEFSRGDCGSCCGQGTGAQTLRGTPASWSWKGIRTFRCRVASPEHGGRGETVPGPVLDPRVRTGNGRCPCPPDGQGRLRTSGRRMCAMGRRGDPGSHAVPPPPVPLPPPYRLQEVAVPIVGNKECNYHYQNSSDSHGQIIKGDMLCAGSEGRDSCQVRPQEALATSSVPFWPRSVGPLPWGRGKLSLRASSPRRWTLGAPWCAAGIAPGSRSES